MNKKQSLSRRQFLQTTGVAAASVTALGLPVNAALAQDSPPADAAAQMAIYNFGGEVQQRIYADAIARFNERYPNVVVEDVYEPTQAGWGGYITNVQLRIASGLPVDIISMAIEGTAETIFQGLVVPLDDIIAADADLQAVVDEVHPSLHNALKVPRGPEGTTYYLTREWNNMIIHYNTTMFDAAGLDYPDPEWTWDDFLETAMALTSGEGGDRVFGYAIPYFNFGLTPWWHTNGTATLTEDWLDSNLDDPKMLESVQFLHSLVHEHGVSPAVEGTNMTELFVSRRAAMSAAGRWPFTNYIANDFYDVDITPWPRKRAGTTVFGSGGYAITKSSANPGLAIELIKDLTDFQTDLDSVAGGTSLPARESATLNEEFNAFPKSAHYYFESLDDIKPVPSPANFSEVESIFMRNLGLIMANSVSAEEGLALAHEELSEAMADLRERMEG
jgi:multiple sugar transport system substrate-binding protein